MDNRQTEEPINGPQAETDTSLVAPLQNTRGDNSRDTKKRPRRKTNPPTTDLKPPTTTIWLNKSDRMLFIRLRFNQYRNSVLLATGAIQSALSEKDLSRIVASHPCALLDEYPASDYSIRIPKGNIVPVRKQSLVNFFLAGRIVLEQSLLLPTMGIILIGMPFFKKYFVTLDLENNLVHFPALFTTTSTQTRKSKRGAIELKARWK